MDNQLETFEVTVSEDRCSEKNSLLRMTTKDKSLLHRVHGLVCR